MKGSVGFGGEENSSEEAPANHQIVGPEILLSSKTAGKGEIIWILGAGMGFSKRWESPSEFSGLPREDHEGRNDNFLGVLPHPLPLPGVSRRRFQELCPLMSLHLLIGVDRC